MKDKAAHINWVPFAFTFGLWLILLSGSLLAEGMFVDGVTYAGISRNMAQDEGSLWNPFYTATLYPVFHQHPPLALALESLFFRLFGDSLAVEKIYSVFVFILTGLLICLVWKKMTGNFKSGWLPLLLWISIPIVSWSATNNLLEGTMSFFVMASVLFMMNGIEGNKWCWTLLASVMLFFAFLSKGFTGLFPLAFPLFCWLFGKKISFKDALIDTLLLVAGLAFCFTVLFIVSPNALSAIKDYLNIQVLKGITTEKTVDSRFFIVGRLVSEVAIPLAIVAVASLVAFFTKHYSKSNGASGWFYVFLALGLSGVLPIMISVKQSGFYMLAALPFFALAFAGFAAGHIQFETLFVGAKPKKAVIILSSMVLIVGLALNLTKIGKYGRDEALLTDMKTILPYLDENEIVSIPQKDFSNWGNHAYFMRYGKVSLDPVGEHNHLVATNRLQNETDLTYIELNTSKLFLYERK